MKCTGDMVVTSNLGRCSSCRKRETHVSRFVSAKQNGESDLIRYGRREAAKRPPAAHRRDKPEPPETSIPRGRFVVLRMIPFTDFDVLMADVQSEAAVRMNTVARIARHVDAKKASA
jgi:hypothetical protein